MDFRQSFKASLRRENDNPVSSEGYLSTRGSDASRSPAEFLEKIIFVTLLNVKLMKIHAISNW